MICRYCGGVVLWRGPLVELTHTQCESCLGINCQEPEDVEEWTQEDEEMHQAQMKFNYEGPEE